MKYPLMAKSTKTQTLEKKKGDGRKKGTDLSTLSLRDVEALEGHLADVQAHFPRLLHPQGADEALREVLETPVLLR